MAWIKRNLLFVVGAVIAIGLLAAAGFYDFKNWQRNNAALDALNQAYVKLQGLYSQNPSPGNDTIDNTKTAGEQERQLRQWIQETEQYFQPISPIPDPAKGAITDARFAGARDHTLNQLQLEAASASVTVPPQYEFSFEAERTLVKFSPGGLDALAQQLGEVKVISEILYAAKINSLDGVRRVRVSNDDASGPQSDYLDQTITTNDLAVFTPYEVTFRCFSQDLAGVLSSFASSPHGFIVKSINVQPAAGVTAASPAGAPGGEMGGFAPPPSFAQPAAPVAPMGRGGLQTVLNEQLLSITLDVEIVKLLPGN
ncbi:MAG TPA: Amuc_1100 family pilus-like protein [Verrucomicrobiae bacterium]|nr:Amuc_1100 family pilus-like protein [Verrucomicrobiae bacterium]